MPRIWFLGGNIGPPLQGYLLVGGGEAVCGSCFFGVSGWNSRASSRRNTNSQARTKAPCRGAPVCAPVYFSRCRGFRGGQTGPPLQGFCGWGRPLRYAEDLVLGWHKILRTQPPKVHRELIEDSERIINVSGFV